MVRAEAELYGCVKATSETLGILSLYRDLGHSVSGSVLSDASATLSMIKKRGYNDRRRRLVI